MACSGSGRRKIEKHGQVVPIGGTGATGRFSHENLALNFHSNLHEPSGEVGNRTKLRLEFLCYYQVPASNPKDWRGIPPILE